LLLDLIIGGTPMGIEFRLGFEGQKLQEYKRAACYASMDARYRKAQSTTPRPKKGTPLEFHVMLTRGQYRENTDKEDRKLFDHIFDHTFGRWFSTRALYKGRWRGERSYLKFDTTKCPWFAIVAAGSFYRLGGETPSFITNYRCVDRCAPELDEWVKYWIAVNMKAGHKNLEIDPLTENIWLGSNTGHMPIDSNRLKSLSMLQMFVDNKIHKRFKSRGSMTANYWTYGFDLSCYGRDSVLMGHDCSVQGWIVDLAKRHQLKSFEKAQTDYESAFRISLPEFIEKVLKPAGLA
jgi:hypothetical protein